MVNNMATGDIDDYYEAERQTVKQILATRNTDWQKLNEWSIR